MKISNSYQPTPDPVYALEPSPNFAEDQIVFAARGSGLYRSSDGGRQWESALASLELSAPLAISCVSLAPNFGKMPHVFAAGPGGILRSKDGGQTWSITMLSSPAPFITGLSISPNYAEDGILFAGTLDDGVFRSLNRGVDWTAWNFGLVDLHILSMVISPNFAEDKNIYLGTESGLFRSLNGGMGWQELDFKINHAPVLSLAISPNFKEDGTIFAGTEAFGVFYSDDQGITWKLIEGLEQVGAVNSILLSKEFPVTPQILIGTDNQLLCSYNYGQTWAPWLLDLQFEHHLLSVTAPKGLYPGTELLVGFDNGNTLNISQDDQSGHIQSE